LRPTILNPLFAPVTALKGVGPRLGKLFDKLTGPQIVDLLWHLPVDIVDRRFQPKVAEATEGSVATLTVKVEAHAKPHNPRQPYRIRCSDETGKLNLVFFHVKDDYLERLLPVGSTRIVSGKVERFNQQAQISHPDYIVDPAAPEHMPLIEADLPADRGTQPAHRAEDGGGSAEPRTGIARMGRRGIPPTPRLARLARGIENRACAGTL